jgi:indole-3-glycerol phosphate synthase
MNILDKIVAVKREEVAHLRPQAASLEQAAAARKDFRDFAAALHRRDGVALIAEVKKASPSAGVIQQNFDAVGIARQYERAGASALSVLTDEKFFQGRLDCLQMIRTEVKLPLLRKDFIIDELQVYESVACGADAILLIVSILDAARLKAFSALAKSLGIAALVEVHDEAELDRAVAVNAKIIGINNRNLRDFSVRLETTERLAAIIRNKVGAPTSVSGRPLIIAESGIHTRADVERVRKAGADAILVGESLMRSGDIAAKVKELIG